VTDPRAADVAAMFDSHFSAVNAKDYAKAIAAYDPAGVINPNDANALTKFQEGVSTTRDRDILLVDSTLSVCGMSALAEELLGLVETEAVNRHINELLVPADAEGSGPGDLLNLLVHAARGAGEIHDVVLRPTDEYGIRYWARIGPCGPPRAALMVLGDGSSIRRSS